jgi:phosphate transport system substrate-binding protein
MKNIQLSTIAYKLIWEDYVHFKKTLIAAITIGSFAFSATIKISGSDTMYRLINDMGKAYKGAKVNVFESGSTSGFKDLVTKKSQIANASRKIKIKEVDALAAKGIKKNYIYEVTIGVDALSIIANKSNSVSKLSIPKLAAIFKGEITNWSDVGGPDHLINLYGRANTSGTYGFFKKTVLSKEGYSERMKALDSNDAVVSAVKADIYGIGYTGVAQAKDSGAKILNLSDDDDLDAYSPLDNDAVNLGYYPIARGLYMYTTKKSYNKSVRKFLQFALSSKGQAIVKKHDFYPVKGKWAARNSRFK